MAEDPQQATKLISKNIEEPDVGIRCYISQLPGFRGILKQRYSDFIVNEVDLEGNVVRLTSLDLAQEMIHKEAAKLPEETERSYDSEIELFKSIAGDSDAEKLKALLDQFRSGDQITMDPIVLSSSTDKSHRTAIHNFFKEKLRFLVTDTIDGPEDTSKCIRVRIGSGENQNRGRGSRKRKDRGDKSFDSRGSDDWQDTGKFLRFHLYKENKDTQEALRVIGKMLGLQPRSFGFAGTKDKRAVTTQRVTIFKQRANKLASLNKRLIGIKVGDFCYVKEGLMLGQLLGNRFTLTLRGVVADSEDTIKYAAEALGKRGFINYFGLQRFGSGAIPTHLIGAALLRGEWKAAVDMILDPREGERDTTRMIREYYKESGDVEGTLKQLPHNMVAERAILQCLKKSPGNYLQALKAVPRTLRMMYVHSYQSYLWNHVASIRMQKYGADQVCLGDLVYSKENCGNDSLVNDQCEENASDDVLHTDIVDELSEAEPIEQGNKPIKVINDEDLRNGTYEVDDIILPLPGSRVAYPNNDIVNVYHDLASKDNISLSESLHNVKEFSITSMTGAYRRVFQKPMDFEWEILTYTDGNKPLTETDLDMISKSKNIEVTPLEAIDSTKGNDGGTGITSCKANAEVDGTIENTCIEATQMALKLSFTLPSSCYATMAIRELLKTSTSVAFHKTLNNPN